MIDVFVERRFDPPLRRQELEVKPRRMHWATRGITWRESLLDRNGRRMLCRFDAPDGATLEDALRQKRVQVDAVWAGRILRLGAPASPATTPPGDALVLAQHRTEDPVTFADLRAVENLCEWCLEKHRIRLVRMLLSIDFTRIVYLYRAPDAESVRLAHRQAGLGLDVVWPYEEVASCLPPGRDAA